VLFVMSHSSVVTIYGRKDRLSFSGWRFAALFCGMFLAGYSSCADAQQVDNRPRLSFSNDEQSAPAARNVAQPTVGANPNAPSGAAESPVNQLFAAPRVVDPKAVNNFSGTEDEAQRAKDIGATTVQNAPVATGLDVPQGAQIDMSNLVVLPDGRIVPIDQVPPRDELAFQSAVSTLAPLRPDQIETIRRKVDDVDRSSVEPLKPEKPNVSSINISLAPGGRPPVIRTGIGRVTALSFYDITGSPYPVSAVVIGNPTQFKVEAPIPEGNLVTISPLTTYAQGNMAITLVNQPVPIMVKLEAGQDVIDYRLDMRVAARGPQAPAALQFVDGAPNVADPIMSAFIDGLPPEGATALTVDGSGVSVWRLKGQMYVRTSMTLLSPAWTNSAAGAGGLKVYAVPEVPILLTSDEGRLVTLKVTGPES